MGNPGAVRTLRPTTFALIQAMGGPDAVGHCALPGKSVCEMRRVERRWDEK